MLLPRAVLCKSLVALVALVRLLPGVDSHMYDEVAGLREAAAAYLAHVLLLLAHVALYVVFMLRLQVLVECRLTGRIVRTDWTVERDALLVVVRSAMTPHI